MTARRTLDELLTGFSHTDLAKLPSYSAFRDALAVLVDETDEPLQRFLHDVRGCVLSSVAGALCNSCGATVFPWRAKRIENRLRGRYTCPCGHDFSHVTDLDNVSWEARAA